MDTDPSVEPGKLFVGGLSWDTTDVGFKEYFEKYGEVAETKIMQDPNGKPRGFGFVTFRDPNSARKVFGEESHYLDGKKIDPKPATLRPLTAQKVFIGGLPANCKDEDVSTACSSFGKVVSVDIKGKGADKNRGFGFVDFDSSASVDSICTKHFIIINDKKVEVKRAEPRKSQRTPGNSAQQQQEMQQQGYTHGSYNYHGMGRGMGGATANPYFQYYGNYSTFASGQQYPGHFPDYRGPYGSQQAPISSYDGGAGGYSQPRGNFGTGTTDHQYSGATGFSGYEHLGFSYPTDQSGSMNYNGHAATAQQRSGYTYGRS